MSSPDPELDALLDAVWQRRRPEVLERLARLQDSLIAAEEDPEAREAARAEAHRLTGSLGMMGFLALSDRTVRVERALRDGEPAAPLTADVRAVEEEVRAHERRPGR